MGADNNADLQVSILFPQQKENWEGLLIVREGGYSSLSSKGSIGNTAGGGSLYSLFPSSPQQVVHGIYLYQNEKSHHMHNTTWPYIVSNTVKYAEHEHRRHDVICVNYPPGIILSNGGCIFGERDEENSAYG